MESNANHPNVLCRVQYLINRKAAADARWKNGDDHVISLPPDEFDALGEALRARETFFVHAKISEHRARGSRHWADDPGVIFFNGCWVTRAKP